MERCKCGKPAMHTTYKWWEDPSRVDQCCECYVKDGNAPSDWHQDCMKTYKNLNPTVPE